jgi:hypothetical protein
MCLGQYPETLSEFEKAENYFQIEEEKNILNYFDSRIRLNTGYIYLFDELKRDGKQIESNFLRKAEEAGQWIRGKILIGRIGSCQCRDVLSALEIMERSNL